MSIQSISVADLQMAKISEVQLALKKLSKIKSVLNKTQTQIPTKLKPVMMSVLHNIEKSKN